MTAGSSVVKVTAKTSLEGKWAKSIFAGMTVIATCLILSLVLGLINYIGGKIATYCVALLFTVFVNIPLILGLIRFYWHIIFGADENIINVFYYFSSADMYLKALKLSIALTVRILIFGFLLFIPAMVVDVLSGTAIYDMFNVAIPMWVSSLWPLSAILKAVGAVVLFFVMLRYYIAPVLVVADEGMDINEALHMSAVISRASSADFIYLIFSLIGWIIISFLVFPLVFLLPYLICTYLVHVRFAIAHFNKTVEMAQSDNIPSYSGV